MRTLKISTLIVALAVVSAAGCASGNNEVVQEVDLLNTMAAPADAVTVDVTNSNWSDVNIYAVSESGQTFRLGTITSNQRQRLAIPAELATSGRFRLAIDPIGATQGYISDPIMVNPGNTIEFTVANSLPQSTYSVH